MENLEALYKEYFKEYDKVLRDCAEKGIACSYGICDECPIHNGRFHNGGIHNGGYVPDKPENDE